VDRDTVVSVIVAIFVVIGWFVKVILAARQEEEPTPRRPRPDPRGNRPRPPQSGRAGSEAERVWEEMLRRRRQAEERQQKPPASKPMATPYARAAEPKPRERPPLTRPPRGPARQAPASPPAVPTARRVEPTPAIQQVVVAEVIEEARVPTQLVVTPRRAPGMRQARALGPGAGQERAVSPALMQLTTLLRSPQTLQTAVVLREIFDAPLARRRGRLRSR
jgi:hypothetical protein